MTMSIMSFASSTAINMSIRSVQRTTGGPLPQAVHSSIKELKS